MFTNIYDDMLDAIVMEFTNYTLITVINSLFGAACVYNCCIPLPDCSIHGPGGFFV